MEIDSRLENLDGAFPDHFTQEQVARAKTFFLKALALRAHHLYQGKTMTMPKASLPGFNWFNVWYTPGVSAVSTAIRDDNDRSFDLTNRDNLVAIVSDSTRVLGDGDVTPPGGLGVMEGKAFLMKYLAGIDAVALCIDSTNRSGLKDPERIIDFVRMVQPSFGAVNLEDISQPNCFRVLDVLREECEIPVWHDDAQGTGCVTLAGLMNALTVVGKRLEDARILMIGAGASMTTGARLMVRAGGDPSRMVMFDSRGSLHAGRKDIESDPSYYRKWELCRITNPSRVETEPEAARGADVIISLSRPDPTRVRPEWIRSMARDPIVFACANPVPEIYPYAAKEAGAAVVATGRGDFPNQVNNSLGFPGILKGALLVRARKVTDDMAVEAARAIAESARRNRLDADHVVPLMDDDDVHERVAGSVAVQAIKDGVARRSLDREDVMARTRHDIGEARRAVKALEDSGIVQAPPIDMIREALREAVDAVK